MSGLKSAAYIIAGVGILLLNANLENELLRILTCGAYGLLVWARAKAEVSP